MPLMGNPSIAFLLYGSTGAVETFTASTTTAAASAASTALAVASDAVSIASATVAVVSASASTAVNSTQVVAEQQADQTYLDVSTPRTLLLALGGLLLLCMLISQPRFLARLFAFRSVKPKPKAKAPAANPFDEKQLQRVERTVGDGGLWQGWWLRRGPVQAAASTTPIDHLYPPPHISPLLAHLPSSSSLLFTPFRHLPHPFKSSMTLVQLYFIVSYLLFIGIALIWKSNLNPATKTVGYGSDFARSGMVALAQVPVVVALGVRGNLIGLCVGKGYDRLKVYHKIVGRIIFLASTVHVGAYVHKWIVAGKFLAYSQKQWAACGFLAYAALLFIAITSLPWVRKAWYGVFEVCHFFGIVGLLVGLCFHVDVAVPFCIAALVVYLLSIVCSLTKTRLAHAELQVLPGAGTTLITIPALRSGWRAGQHVRIRVPALGLAHGLESHPFTIASAPNGEGMILMCKNAGNWTERLYHLAQCSDMERGAGQRQSVTIILEGPYGGLGNTMLSSFSSTVLVAGGSGITHALALAHDLVRRAPAGAVRSRTIDLVWIVRNEAAAKPLMATLLELVDQAKAQEQDCIEGRRNGEDLPPPTALRVQIFVTRCPASSPLTLLSPTENPFEDEDEDEETKPDSKYTEAEREKRAYLQRNPSSTSTSSYLSTGHSGALSGITATPLRPNFPNLLNGIADQTIHAHRRMRVEGSGICVTACGPSSLVDDVREAVRKVEGYKARAVGGVEFEEEHFGF